MPHHTMMASVDLKTKQGTSWTLRTGWLSLLSSAVLSIVHPGLYRSSRSAMLSLAEDKLLKPYIDNWPSVFNGVQIIGNRITPRHRDANSLQEWYDVLISIGPYKNAEMRLYNLGVKLPYPPGSIIAIGGKTIEHGVEEFTGERVCMAFFMRQNVQQRAKAKNEGWSTLDRVKQLYF
jgi:hypothetical protein